MRFGIVITNKAPYCDRGLLAEAASVAEDEGFDSLFVWDHYMLPESSSTLEAWSLLAYLASKTSTIKLGTCVTPIPFRPPGILAKIVSTLDILSNGRVIVGAGAGWHKPEFEGYSKWADSTTRVSQTEEGLKLMIELWTKDAVNFAGKYYVAKEAVLEPKPIQKPYPPIWIGSRSPRMLKLTGRMGNGWIPVHLPVERYGEALSVIEREARNHGRIGKITYAYDSDPIEDVRKLIQEVETYRKKRCEYFVIAWLYPLERFIRKIRETARELIPSFR